MNFFVVFRGLDDDFDRLEDDFDRLEDDFDGLEDDFEDGIEPLAIDFALSVSRPKGHPA